MINDEYRVRTPLFPLYSEVRHLLRILEGVPRAEVTSLVRAISEQTGTPQNPVDWSDPDQWIAERLSGDHEALARRIWEESRRTVNPRHMYWAYLFINTHGLLRCDATGLHQATERGAAFLRGASEVVKEVDEVEGIGELLSIMATEQTARRSDLLPEWSVFLSQHSKFRTPATARDTLRRRLLNLTERKLVSRQGHTYTITDQGARYAQEFSIVSLDPSRDVARAVDAYNRAQREALRERLSRMHPRRFEEIVRRLLEAMGYEDVTVTKDSGDKGVDVVATVQFGITTITEVVQVKRRTGTTGRPVLDQLRGALPYHEAIRGTLITLGRFSRGCTEAALFPGAAPITLIDGEKLLELLAEHEVGVRSRRVALHELDESAFSSLDELEADIPAPQLMGAEQSEQSHSQRGGSCE